MLFDQLEEVSREVSAGLISADDGDAVRVEIKRRLIAVDHRNPSTDVVQNSGSWAMLAASIFVPVSALAVYTIIGSPEIPSAAFSQRFEELSAARTRADQVLQLVETLNADTNGGTISGWVRAAEIYMESGGYAEAANAYGRILGRREVTFAEFAKYAEALILSHKGIVTPPAQRALETSLKMEPGNVAGLFYSSFALEQAGQIEAAYDLLVSKLSEADGNFPWMEAYVARANHYGKKLGRPAVALAEFTTDATGSSTADMARAATMTAQERSAFISSMVEGLAERLKDEPDDLEGWLKLGRAYLVLGKQQEALDAYRQAKPLAVDLPVGDKRKELVLEKIRELQ
jgi:cytochrome c-type biogenesis protein CcmH